MTTKLFTFTKMSENSMIASVRIARFVSQELEVPVTTDATIADGKIDTLIIVNGAYAFCKDLEALGAAIEKARHVAWIQNDYTIIPPKPIGNAESPFRKAFRNRRDRGQSDVDFWTTCEDWTKLTPGSHYVNWNCLTFDVNYNLKNIRDRRRKSSADLFYYGSWRGGGGRSSREIYFDRYFYEPAVDTVISTPAKQFAEKYPRIKTIAPMRDYLYDVIGSFGMGLYVEDRMSHDRFHSPANRFYEMLSAGLPIVFQPECGMGLRRAGYDPEPFYAEKAKHVKLKMSMREEIGDSQRRLWAERAQTERGELSGRLQAALAKLEDA